ncbi:TIGR02679 family protein, partial [Frankia nepalensis]
DGTGLLRRLAGDPAAAGALAGPLVAVLDGLPSPGVALGRLATTLAGDAHALDDGRPLATLALAGARVLAGSGPAGGGSAAERRATWAAVGVHLDELSSTVLCLGLPGGPGSAAGRLLAVAHEAGEPCVLTLRQVTGRGGERADPGVGAGPVFVCENPAVLATAADELGRAAPPLVCVNGQPSAAVLGLLDALAAGGARLAYHGDFDWRGLRIANGLRDRVPWEPWRFDAAAYEEALDAVGGGPLSGHPVDASWDPALRPALERRAVRLAEELVLPALLADLAAAGRGVASA